MRPPYAHGAGFKQALRRPVPRYLILLWMGALLCTAPAGAQTPDSLAAEGLRPSNLPEGHTPRGALWRAAAVPGWGQLYNRQYYKIPIVYVGLGAIVGLALQLNDRYLFYRHAYLYKAWQQQLAEGETNPFAQYEPVYAELAERYGEVEASRIRPIRDNFRRNRDLSYFGIGLVYGLTMLDAYVSAHLLDFDIGEDLSFRVLPRVLPAGASLEIHLSGRF